ncbi:hypothetical protein Q7A53_05365 [Halobacillus rhizosphaerae]|uniref:hypothetical protein n=1 Tax=Halobacillus rhizosphaerae TaxID=3064889 RepID=UPI00398A933B
MKATTAYAITWIATSIAISVAIITTGSLFPLLCLIFPATLSFEISGNENGESNDKE